MNQPAAMAVTGYFDSSALVKTLPGRDRIVLGTDLV
jgi:hypothetical protein